MDIFYETPPYRIGKHEWRCQVIPFWLKPDQRCTHWDFRRIGETRWRPDTEFPGYNGDDTYNGLPRTLNRMFDLYRRDIEAALEARQPESAPHFVLL